MFLQRLLLVLLPAATSVHAWGALGHEMTGALAQSLISPSTQAKLAVFFDAKLDLEEESTWADRIKRSVHWADHLHYISADNLSPSGCKVDYVRDCPNDQCVVGAIGNYTQRLGQCNGSRASRQEAARFLTHFVGDLSQPLHVCKRDRGGNEARVSFDNRRNVALHAVWDTSIVEKRLKTTFKGDRDTYLTHLKSMVSSIGTQDACFAGEALDGKQCALDWANDSSDINCKAVWPDFDQNASVNFGGRYYEKSWPVVERQLVKAGVRLAALLDRIMGSCGNSAEEGEASSRPESHM